ncbi:MAG: rhodanese-like domain-containing protein [Akkermansiaceae bacterium]|jgi:rhodanese-related sulfurtransferase|nr:rhodanese-like domain-containing protein [Akkermansiaceae bacterium]MDP4648117.1 rhodanese-like domain-containing protein [Akkermansiaceae bacterium]MDP4719669.1 rhodanese-like domain-containing protein [Akkermansiaceae bacterium]MDP4780613.1 rhodanese-like domain-containing protein [Akkermansiaceae bacterium]MDP4846844.1 rhodanese-like domain-containing protein [Akkermansiaceae bacterium]
MDVETKMGVLMAEMPGAKRALFARYHLGGCQSCAFDDDETLAKLCERAELDAGEVLEHLLASHEHDLTMLMVPKDVAAREDVRFVDVRTREEHEAVKIAGSEFFTQEIQEKIFKEKPGGVVVLYDHTGKYVLDQVAWFRGHGIENAFGMTGGIDAWSREVDSKVMRYRVEV